MLAGRGDELPVSAFPVDGTYPSGTAAYEKRNISELVPVWEPDLCIQCGHCSFVCPHSVIRAKVLRPTQLDGRAGGLPSAPLDARGLPDARYTLQIYVEDCTGCGLCVEICPATARRPGAQGDQPRAATSRCPEPSATNIAFFETLPVNDRARVDFANVRGTQFLEPLFEFSGACAGCGETPYLKLLTQLFGDRLLIANATGCSSIYGGNLPTTPWTTDADGRGPAWSNSLFEDNAEFGLGFRLAADSTRALARRRSTELRDAVGAELVDALLDAPQRDESELARAARPRRRAASSALAGLDGPGRRRPAQRRRPPRRRSVWIVGGDGWAYDIGSGGLDHVLATGRDVNVLVLDTEVYSNTGGQASKATPLGAAAKFAAAGKTVPQEGPRAPGDRLRQRLRRPGRDGRGPAADAVALREAEAYDGPVADPSPTATASRTASTCARGSTSRTAPWPAATGRSCRYDPVMRAAGGNPFRLDSPRPRMPLAGLHVQRAALPLADAADPAEAERLLGLAQQAVDQRLRPTRRWRPRGAQPSSPPTPRSDGVNLSTRYLGLELRNPLVASASPLSQTVDGIRALADAGVGAVVLLLALRGAARGARQRRSRRSRPAQTSFAESLVVLAGGRPSTPAARALPAPARARRRPPSTCR